MKTATLQERAMEKKDSLKSLKASVGQRHFNCPMVDWDQNWDKGWNKDGH